ncbi:MAG: hypothetical protein HXX13_02965 [Bacteroidetes bacterium]|nr:hypothetical protein [Bacteroidota bacterium]
MKLPQFATIVFLLSFSFHSVGQATIKCNENKFEDPFLENIIGSWDATGKIGTDPVAYHFTGNWELNHQFILLSFADTARQPQYIARVYIGVDCVSERYVVHWLDNFGGRFSETLGYGTRSGDSIPFRFEYPDGPFINTFTYDNSLDSWQFHSETKNSKGIWEPFGDIYLKRVK